jgi:hypothetical protein
MPRSVARASLYRAPINLWVEDELSREYLAAVWNDPAVAFFLGGGNEGVRAVVEDAGNAGFRNVFALIDRDFRPTNKPGWIDPNKTFRTFVLPVHEMENYLLDAKALAGIRFNNLGRTSAEIVGKMNQVAGRLCWWAACRDVVAELRRRFRSEFIPDPRYPPVDTEVEAQRHICNSPWFLKLASEAGRTTVPDVHRLLSDGHTEATAQLADGRWRVEFAGKEILRGVGSWICDRTKIPHQYSSSAEFDADLAKEVAAYQVRNKQVPPDLTDLLSALKRRIAAPTPPP